MKKILSSASFFALALPLSVCAAPDEEALGKTHAYPTGTIRNYWFDDAVRVGSASNRNQIVQPRSSALIFTAVF